MHLQILRESDGNELLVLLGRVHEQTNEWARADIPVITDMCDIPENHFPATGSRETTSWIPDFQTRTQ